MSGPCPTATCEISCHTSDRNENWNIKPSRRDDSVRRTTARFVQSNSGQASRFDRTSARPFVFDDMFVIQIREYLVREREREKDPQTLHSCAQSFYRATKNLKSSTLVGELREKAKARTVLRLAPKTIHQCKVHGQIQGLARCCRTQMPVQHPTRAPFASALCVLENQFLA